MPLRRAPCPRVAGQEARDQPAFDTRPLPAQVGRPRLTRANPAVVSAATHRWAKFFASPRLIRCTWSWPALVSCLLRSESTPSRDGTVGSVSPSRTTNESHRTHGGGGVPGGQPP